MLIVMGRMMTVMLTKRMLLCVNREGGFSNKFLDELMFESANKDFEIEHFIPFDVATLSLLPPLPPKPNTIRPSEVLTR